MKSTIVHLILMEQVEMEVLFIYYQMNEVTFLLKFIILNLIRMLDFYMELQFMSLKKYNIKDINFNELFM